MLPGSTGHFPNTMGGTFAIRVVDPRSMGQRKHIPVWSCWYELEKTPSLVSPQEQQTNRTSSPAPPCGPVVPKPAVGSPGVRLGRRVASKMGQMKGNSGDSVFLVSCFFGPLGV